MWAEAAGVEDKGEDLALVLTASDIVKEALPHHMLQDQANAEH